MLAKAATNPSLLKSFHKLNPSKRKKRREREEAFISLGQYLVAKWLDLTTLRCARPCNKNILAKSTKHGMASDFLLAPDTLHLALNISRTGWKGQGRLSRSRTKRALKDWKAAGYISTPTQTRTQCLDGRWVGHPPIIHFRKKFFLEIGGKKLWKRVRASVSERWKKTKEKWHVMLQGVYADSDYELSQYLKPGLVLSPRQARFFQQQAPPDKPIPFSHTRLKPR